MGARFGHFLQDAQFAWRQVLRNPGFALSAITAIALGVGANTAIFSVVNAVLLRPLGYPNANRMVNFLVPSTEVASDLHSIPQFHFSERQTQLFKEVVAFDNAGPGFNLTGGSRPEQAHPTAWGARGRQFKSARPDHCIACSRRGLSAAFLFLADPRSIPTRHTGPAAKRPRY